MLRVGVLVSGGGTNLQAIIDKIDSGYIKNCEIVIVIASKKEAYALERATKYGISTICIPKKDFSSTCEYDAAILHHLQEKNVDLVVLAGFMIILGAKFMDAYKNRIINVHPSLIPAFCGKGFYGLKPHQAALEYGVKVTGATVHIVEMETDAGPIILQKAISINEEDTPESLQKRVMEEVEWDILPEAVKLFAEGRVVIEGRKTRII